MKIAIVHEWFRMNAGSEKVVGALIQDHREDEVEVFALFEKMTEEDRKEVLHGLKPRTSLLQHLPGVYKYYRYLLPLMPLFIRMFRVAGYDLILSSSHAVAKGFRRDKSIPHICYCHTPMRYAWDLYEDYALGKGWLKSWLYGVVVRRIRRWDYRSAKNVDFFVANSENVRRRIASNYGRDAKVIYPPVRVDRFVLAPVPRKDRYLCVGRFVPYKKVDIIVKAFKGMPDKKLLLVGDGYDATTISGLLQHVPNVTWLGYKNDDELIRLMQQSKACIFAAKEDFGIMCVEAQACGTPVLAYKYGGHLETVIDGETGYLFEEQSAESIQEALCRFEANPLTDHQRIRKNAERFSSARFHAEMNAFIAECISYHQRGFVAHESIYSV